MRFLFRLFILLILLINPLFADFGQNKVQYENLNWKRIQSQHFDIYFYNEGQHLAEFVADEAESSYVKLSRDFNYQLVDRISFVIYNSHADFEETNISPEVISTSVGGFTEFFKNRIVIPFEGSYEKFRHVLHHELTHAVSLQFFFGAGPGSILKGISRLNLPLWFVEGMAEYMSLRWDTNSDMFLRDASISGYLPPISHLSAYLAYKGGQSLYYYIAKTYGDKKVSEMLWSVRNRRSVERGIQEALRIDLDELSVQWQTAMRKQYWPDIKDRKTPREIALQLTDNQKWQNFVNNSPAISPNGDKIAFLSDKSGYFDIYLMSAIDGKIEGRLVQGQRKSDLEDLNWLTPGMSWSGDSKFLVFAAKSGPEDALNIIDVEERKVVKSLKFGMNAIFSPDWNPTTNEIAFIGMQKASTDIYVYNLDTGQLNRLTSDIFSDMEPAWAPDGRHLAFTSDRGKFVEPDLFPEKLRIQDFDYHQTDIYIIDTKTKEITRKTETKDFQEISPEFTPDGQLAFISDRNGIFNIFIQNMKTGEEKPLTNLLTGCSQLSWSLNANRLAFTAFGGGGYNIYMWIDPLHAQDKEPVLENTVFINDLQHGIEVGEMDYDTEPEKEQKELLAKMQSRQDFRHYIFESDFAQGRINAPRNRAKEVKLEESEYKDEDGNYFAQKYKTKFTIDYAGGQFGYDPFWGMQGLTQILFSDMLGDRQIGLGINLIQSLQDSDFLLSYAHLPWRWDIYTSAYHFVDFFLTNIGGGYTDIVRFRNYGAGFQVSYPISRFLRINTGLNSLNVAEDFMNYPLYNSPALHALVPSIGITGDNTIWSFFGPAAGHRWNLSFGISPAIWTTSPDFKTVTADYRRYHSFGPEYSLAWRLTGGISVGDNPQRFVLGGLSNWLNYRFGRNIPYSDIQDLFFSSYIMPLRGSDYYAQYGSRFFLTNFEFKFPLIDYLIMRFPLPLGLSYIRGAGFLDAGSAWNDDKAYKPFGKNELGETVTQDLILGFGYGFRIYLGFAVLRIDTAWRTDLQTYSSPIYLFSLGADF